MIDANEKVQGHFQFVKVTQNGETLSQKQVDETFSPTHDMAEREQLLLVDK